MENAQLLKQMFLFQELSGLELIHVNKILGQRKVAAGEIILQEDAAPDYMYILKSGRVRVTRAASTGEEVICELQTGDHFGEIALIDKGPRSASVAAVSPCELLTLHERDFNQLLAAHPALRDKVHRAFLAVLCQRLRATNDTLITSSHAGQPPA